MHDDSKKKKDYFPKPKWLLWCVPIAFLTPLIFTLKSGIADFTLTGNIGDTIGGITAPFLSAIGIFMVYFTLKAQIDTNADIQKRMNDENEMANLNTLFQSFEKSFENFSYEITDEQNQTKELKGSSAFHHFLEDLYCSAHEGNNLNENPKVSELRNILYLTTELSKRLKESSVSSAETLKKIVKYNFENIICPKIRDMNLEDLFGRECVECSADDNPITHALPNEFAQLIGMTRAHLADE